MKFDLQHQPLVDRSLSLAAGVLFTYLSISIIGYGAAIAVPVGVLLPLMQLSPTFALSLTDFVTIGVPLAISFYLLALVFRRLVSMVYLPLLVSPFILFMLYGSVPSALRSEEMWYHFALTLAKLLPVLVCAILLAKQDTYNNKT